MVIVEKFKLQPLFIGLLQKKFIDCQTNEINLFNHYI